MGCNQERNQHNLSTWFYPSSHFSGASDINDELDSNASLADAHPLKGQKWGLIMWSSSAASEQSRDSF